MRETHMQFYTWLSEVNDYLSDFLGLMRWSQMEPDEEPWWNLYEEGLAPSEAAETMADLSYKEQHND